MTAVFPSNITRNMPLSPSLLMKILVSDDFSCAVLVSFINSFAINLNEENTENALNLLVDYLHGFALAMKCSKQENQLSIAMITDPLYLYGRALRNLTNLCPPFKNKFNMLYYQQQVKGR